MKDKRMDIVYTVRPGDNNDELRYSLRSLQNLPHGKVFIVGYKPEWVKNVEYIPTEQNGLKYENTTNNLITICKNKNVSEDFILMNDDFYILKPIEELQHYNRGPIEEILEIYNGDGIYAQGMRETRDYMEKLGYKNILSYELHIPMIFNKKNVLQMFKQLDKDKPEICVLHKRTLYGNMFNYGGESVKDVKQYKIITKQFTDDNIFLSTNDDKMNGRTPASEVLFEKFKHKSQYEE